MPTDTVLLGHPCSIGTFVDVCNFGLRTLNSSTSQLFVVGPASIATARNRGSYTIRSWAVACIWSSLRKTRTSTVLLRIKRSSESTTLCLIPIWVPSSFYLNFILTVICLTKFLQIVLNFSIFFNPTVARAFYKTKDRFKNNNSYNLYLYIYIWDTSIIDLYYTYFVKCFVPYT